MWLEARYEAVDLETGALEGYLPDVGYELLDVGYDFTGWVACVQGGHRSVSAALGAADGLAFAFPMWVFGAAQLSLKTLLEDGTIIDTATLPSHYLVPLIRGKVHHPRAGHLLNVVQLSSADAMRESHEAAVAAWSARLGTRVYTHGDVHVAVAIQNRLARIRIARFWTSVALATGLSVVLAATVAKLSPWWFGVSLHLLLSILVFMWLAPALAARLPVVGRQSAEQLVGPVTARDDDDGLLQ